MPIKVNKIQHVEDFLLDLDAIMYEHGIEKADVVIQLGVTEPRVKVSGNLAYGQWRNDLCKCGCRLRRADNIVWCSSPRCTFVGGV